jgi:hypothetical protein
MDLVVHKKSAAQPEGERHCQGLACDAGRAAFVAAVGSTLSQAQEQKVGLLIELDKVRRRRPKVVQLKA